MRRIENNQLQLGEQCISEIYLDPKSRDDIPQILRGLQHIYTTPELREEVFKILEEIVPVNIDSQNGRPGMILWKILVFGALRLDLNCDYDRLLELANNHKTIRQMLQHGMIDDNKEYKLQTLKENVSLLTPEVLDKINQVVINAGHKLLKKKEGESLRGRCDSFVLETDAHYPTDINLLFDAIRKVIELAAGLSADFGLTSWRQKVYNLRKVKKLFTRARKLKHSTSENPQRKKAREEIIIEAHKAYIEVVNSYLGKVGQTLTELRGKDIMTDLRIVEIEKYIAHANRQIDQIERRVINDEDIPHNEKVFSIFEEHTEWISKGKAGVPVELGLKVCVLEDQHGFILHHRVMEKETDEQIAVSMVKETQKRFPALALCSFDKGFHSPSNQEELRQLLENVVLPKKGKLSRKDKEVEHSEEFIKARRQHSAVESAINALEVHGLDRCLDHGLYGFKRYVSLAIVARNIQKLGAMLQAKEKKEKEHRKKAA